jgi:membrane protein
MSGLKRLIARAKELLARLRRRFGWLDHIIRAYQHYSTVKGNRLAAAVTYFGFLSLFPLLALAFAAFGIVLENNPDVEEEVFDAISNALPGFVGGEGAPINPNRLQDAATAAGIIGAITLLFTGTGLVDAIREALHVVWNRGDVKVNFVLRKIADVLLLVVVGVIIVASVAVSSVTTSFASVLLNAVGLEGSSVARVLFAALTVLVALLLDTVVILVLFLRLSGAAPPLRDAVKGALLGAVGVELVKLLATSLLGAMRNPVYATIALVIGLLLWISIVARLLIFAASWTVTLTAAPDTGPAPVILPAPSPATPQPAASRSGARGFAAGVGVLLITLLRGRRSG